MLIHVICHKMKAKSKKSNPAFKQRQVLPFLPEFVAPIDFTKNALPPPPLDKEKHQMEVLHPTWVTTA